MDYDDILFGLQPILNVPSVKDIPLDQVYLEGYLTVLDQLAVHLRAPTNRDIVGQTGLLGNLLRVLVNVLEQCFHSEDRAISWFKLASELVRCVANCMVDNDANRAIVVNDMDSRNEIIDYYVGRILQLTDIQDDTAELLPQLQMRTVVLLKNLCLDNETYTKRCAPYVRGPLWNFIIGSKHTYLSEIDSLLVATEFLADVADVHYDNISIEDIAAMADVLQYLCPSIPQIMDGDNTEETEEPTTALVFNISKVLEIVLDKDLTLELPQQTASMLYAQFISSLNILNDKEFANKLILMRRLVSIIGYISTNKTVCNREMRKLCIDTLRDSHNGYTIAAILLIVTNSIESRRDAEDVLSEISFPHLLELTKYLQDPIQYQGLLDLLRKTLHVSVAMSLTEQDLSHISNFLQACHNQAQFFPQMSQLVGNLLNKFLTTIPSASLRTAITQDEKLLKIIEERGSLSAALALDKLLVASKATNPEIFRSLWETLFQFKDSSFTSENAGLSATTTFQITKTIGIYLRNITASSHNILFSEYSDRLLQLLTSAQHLQNKTDKGSISIINNTKFVSGMILKLLENKETLTAQESQLQAAARGYF